MDQHGAPESAYVRSVSGKWTVRYHVDPHTPELTVGFRSRPPRTTAVRYNWQSNVARVSPGGPDFHWTPYRLNHRVPNRYTRHRYLSSWHPDRVPTRATSAGRVQFTRWIYSIVQRVHNVTLFDVRRRVVVVVSGYCILSPLSCTLVDPCMACKNYYSSRSRVRTWYYYAGILYIMIISRGRRVILYCDTIACYFMN